ncbi:MAG: bis(5'-nucleosyl)-tetraphosphatase (symmetrical) YqeK [Clostridiales bacterium]|nr:bis(5'-nucleosyl)-tetraphosphatase (symmetrical) YqeK [Clostridiales bacterium]
MIAERIGSPRREWSNGRKQEFDTTVREQMERTMKYKEIQQHLKESLKETRFRHTMGVVETAVQLAQIYGCSKKKAKYAALLHDCAKYLPDQDKITMCRREGVPISRAEMENPSLLHAKCGAILARQVYGVEDEEILHAIRVHTTGVPNMSLLDQILFVADYIEPGRTSAPNLDRLRELSLHDLDMTTYRILEDTVSYLNDIKDAGIDPTTMKTWQFYKELTSL